MAHGKVLWRAAALILILPVLTCAARDPFSDAGRLVAMGDAHMRSGEYTLARQAYAEAISALSSRPALCLRLGTAQAALHEWEEATQSLALAANAPWTRARALTGLAAAEEDAYRAGCLWADALRAGWNDPHVLGRYVDMIWRRGDFAQSQPALGRWLRLAPSDEKARLRAAILRVLEDNPQAAMVLLRGMDAGGPLRAALSVGDAPGSPEFYLRAGVALLSTGEHRAAQVLFGRARDLAPDSPVAQTYYAYCLHLAGDEAGALGLLRDAAARWPSYPLVWYFLGEAERDAGNFAAARAHYGTLLRLDPKNAAACVAMADTYAAENLLHDAEAWYVRATEYAPQDGRFWLALARFYVEHLAGVGGNGVAAARKVVSLLPEDPAAHDTLGWALFLSNDLDGARAALDTALRLDSNDPSVQYHAGSLYYALGDRAKALYHLTRVLDVQPEGRFADLARDLLRQLR